MQVVGCLTFHLIFLHGIKMKILHNCLTHRRSLSIDGQCLHEEIWEFRLGSCWLRRRVVYCKLTELLRNLLSSLQTLDMQEAFFFRNVGCHQYDRQIRLQITLDITPPFVHRTLWRYVGGDIECLDS